MIVAKETSELIAADADMVRTVEVSKNLYIDPTSDPSSLHSLVQHRCEKPNAKT